jgi:FtsH-binding integral membrane protein
MLLHHSTLSASSHSIPSTWAIYVPMFGTLINLGLLYWKRHSHPWNFVLLSTFTVMEAFTLGVVVAFYNHTVVMQAL